VPRPARHDADGFLDVAARLCAGGGPEAVTMSAVAHAADASNGSLYHRFPDRATLLAALWLRTTTRFHACVYPLLGQPADPGSAVAVGRHVVSWTRDHADEARVLLAGRRALTQQAWPAELVAAVDREDSRFRTAVAAFVRDYADAAGLDRVLVSLAVADLPLAAVRGALLSGRAVSDRLERTVAHAVTKLLAPETG
jgi:AcrR family transcriptional regulator